MWARTLAWRRAWGVRGGLVAAAGGGRKIRFWGGYMKGCCEIPGGGDNQEGVMLR